MNAGRHVHLVDLHSAVSTADLADGIHPNALGYDKMAAAWFAALQSVSGSIGTPGGGGTGARQIVGAQSGRCLDVTGAATAGGTPVELWDCNGQANQSWTPTTSGQLTVYGNACLDVSGQAPASGAAAVISACTGQAVQQWTVDSAGTISHAQSGLCLDASGQATANGTKVIVWSCNGQQNQRWTLR